jgi:hypothetical protein
MNYKLIISVLIVLSVLVTPELLLASPYFDESQISSYELLRRIIGGIGALLTFMGFSVVIAHKKLSIKLFIMIFIGLLFLFYFRYC